MRSLTIPLLLIVTAALLPFFVGSYWMHVLIIGFYYALLASSWSLLAGYAGQFSFGHVALAAIGTYTSAGLVLGFGLSPFIGLFAGAVAAASVSYLLGTLCLRMKGPYLALTTIAFSETLRLIISAEYEYTRGTLGLSVPALYGLSKIPYYYSFLLILIVSLLVMNKIVNSKIGLFFRSIREDEDAAAAMGVNVIRYKVLAFTISGFFAGLAGAFYGHYILLVSPHMMFIYEMGLIVSMVVIGGIESLIGPVFGAVILETLSEYLRVYGEYYRVIFGALLIITLKFSPRGLILPGFMALMRTFGIMGKVKADGGQYPKGEKH